MLARTHIAIGIIIGFVLSHEMTFSNPAKWLIVILCIIGALFPDIDHPSSLLGRRIKWISPVLFEHRGIMHSVWPIAALASGALLLQAPVEWVVAFSLGFTSHLLLDSMTFSGIKPLFPLPLRIKGFCKTGGLIDHVIFIAAVFVCISLGILSFTNK